MHFPNGTKNTLNNVLLSKSEFVSVLIVLIQGHLCFNLDPLGLQDFLMDQLYCGNLLLDSHIDQHIPYEDSESLISSIYLNSVHSDFDGVLSGSH